MMKTSNVIFGIKGEPAIGIIFQDRKEGVKLTYDPNWQVISFWNEEDVLYDHLDCAIFRDWENVRRELKTEYGIVLSL
ncbi:MAG: hypothetical protein IJK42_11935 [Prevotella sp.]|nr:hypothetical protein [Prevotella sp.]MBQ6210459.1 hypothetical protein [Prevotella sp.]